MQAHQLRSQTTHGHGPALLSRKFRRGIQILEQRADMPFHWLELALGHLWRQYLQWARVGETACQGWCEHAPVMQLLPEGRIFSAPALDQAPAVVQACLDGGKALEPGLIWDYSLTRAQNLARKGS